MVLQDQGGESEQRWVVRDMEVRLYQQVLRGEADRSGRCPQVSCREKGGVRQGQEASVPPATGVGVTLWTWPALPSLGLFPLCEMKWSGSSLPLGIF